MGGGSYLIHSLTKTLTNSLDRKCHRRCCGPMYLGEIMDQIQEVLENKEKQLVVPVYINQTERIVFRRRSNAPLSRKERVKTHSTVINSDSDRRDEKESSFGVELASRAGGEYN